MSLINSQRSYSMRRRLTNTASRILEPPLEPVQRGALSTVALPPRRSTRLASSATPVARHSAGGGTRTPDTRIMIMAECLRELAADRRFGFRPRNISPAGSQVLAGRRAPCCPPVAHLASTANDFGTHDPPGD